MTDLVWPKLKRLATCVCEGIEECLIQPVCFCGVVPGAGVALDYIHSGDCEDDGMAWVRLVNEYPVGDPKRQKCGVEIGISVEVGIVRSMPLHDDGGPPTAEEYEAVAEQQIEEAAVLRKAILCCFGSGVTLGVYTPIGPTGGAVGGYWAATIPTAEPDDDD